MDPIMALATPLSTSALAVIRLSGDNLLSLINPLLDKAIPANSRGNQTYYRNLSYQSQLLDEVIITYYKAPKSYTTEDLIEISCHGSPFIIGNIIQAILSEGVRYANPGEFTQRAYLNGRIDLIQAEAVADLIQTDSALGFELAMHQLKGNISNKLSRIRQNLIDFLSLIELELDFGEEDVAFTDRSGFNNLLEGILSIIEPMINSYKTGNAVKEGIPVAIAGKPNAGKSTLLNALVGEEKAIVSDIPGTTRDAIEDILFINNIKFRIIDTAGLRQTEDKIELLGIERTRQKLEQAQVIVYLFDCLSLSENALKAELESLSYPVPIIPVGNKSDLVREEARQSFTAQFPGMLFISALLQSGIDSLKESIYEQTLGAGLRPGEAVLTNIRHYQELLQVRESLLHFKEGLSQSLTTDLLAFHLRQAVQHLGLITGEISTDDILGNIFSHFCIGK
jgi:tRNA modification GTPase